MTTTQNNELTNKVEEVIQQIRPYLQADGGDIKLVEVTSDNVVRVKLAGACHSCPMRIQTIKNGVEQAVKKYVPEVKEVVNVEY